MEITTKLVRQLIDEQFPKWKELEIKPVLYSGNDNRTFHLGKDMTIRLPSAKKYVAQVEKEARWLPYLAKHLSLPISCPIEIGKPTTDYPFPWSINRFIEGEAVNQVKHVNQEVLAKELALFLKELQSIDIKDAPVAGEHNFFRGANPIVYTDQVEDVLQQRKDLPTQKLETIWKNTIASNWEIPPVWIHGDIAPGNLLIKDGHLCGVIDFGIMGIGDPACDYAMAWSFFDEANRNDLLQYLDINTINRARGWALWKALITYDDINPLVSKNAKYTVKVILEEYDKNIIERKR